jgi:hypothetical protein
MLEDLPTDLVSFSLSFSESLFSLSHSLLFFPFFSSFFFPFFFPFPFFSPGGGGLGGLDEPENYCTLLYNEYQVITRTVNFTLRKESYIDAP